MFRSTPGEPESVLVQPPRGLRAAGWALIISGALLWANEALIRSGAAAMALAVVAGGAGVYATVRAWRILPRLRWLGLVAVAVSAAAILAGPLARVGAAWVLAGLGATLRSQARERHVH
ncbi:MAG: hypothetical protein ACOX3S_15560 [Anaerolineae bacterium]|jgi:hypothetical protein